MGSSVNRITYLEPNNLPKEFAAKAVNGVVLDNITWNPEDLNISVDLQVIIPSRKYRKSDTVTDYNEALLNRQSILSGVILDPKKSGDTFLTTDYTNISYQEIKNNNAGSKEMLGINSIHITFDSHMYPRVTMNFTDVRGASLMMPQEQYVYDMGANKITGKDNPVCQNFFQSFFKFPYPQFLLSVKGIYGTCVTFVLSVEDFKASFNSESGNFDVVVTFIGLMYGLYTDIPMNYLIMAPYIGSSNGSLTNEYWRSKTEHGGEFFFSEKDGSENQPISTFFEFVNNYKDLISLEQGKDGFIYGPGIAEIGRIQKEISELEKIRDYFDSIKDNIVSDASNKIEYREVIVSDLHILFLKSSKSSISKVVFNTSFVNNFKDALDGYEKEHGTLIQNKKDVPGILSSGKNVIDTIYNGDKNIFALNEEGKYTFKAGSEKTEEITFYLKLVNDGYGRYIQDIEKHITKDFEDTKCGIVYTEQFKSIITSKIEELSENANSLQEEATNEMIELFKNSCGFTPTVENIMRMLFAHIDTFLHEFYSVLESISVKERKLGKDIPWKKDYTDIQSSSENPDIPPFAAFYKKKDEHLERTYPSPELKNLDEILFVEEILNGLSNRLKEEAKKAKERTDAVNSQSEVRNFIPIAITDYFYNSNPYSYIDVNNLDVYQVLYFVLCRLYVSFRDCEKKWKDEIINSEFENLKNSKVWDFLASNKDKFFKNLNNFDEWVKRNDVKIFGITKEDGRNYNVIKAYDGHDYFKFNGLSNLRGIDNNKNNRDTIEYKFIEADRKKVSEFIKLSTKCLKGDNDKDKSTRIDSETNFFRRDYRKNYPSILQPLDNDNNPITDGNQRQVKLQAETDIHTFGGSVITTQELLSSSSVWVPVILTNKKKGENILINYTNNPLYNKDINILLKSAWFLAKLLDYEDIAKSFDFSHDYLFHIQKSVLYAIGAYYKLENYETEIDAEKQALKEVKKIIGEIYPRFITQKDKDSLLASFENWTNIVFTEIMNLAENELKSGEHPYYVTFSGVYRAISPKNRELQKILIKLVTEDCFIVSLSKTADYNVHNILGRIDDGSVINFCNLVNTELEKVDNNTEVENSRIATNVPINGSDENLKISLYYTLKNLYDRWLSIYSYDNFKLEKPGVKRDRNSKHYSEFDNFLYVDSFYNDISKEFMINPKNFFNLVNEQIAGNTNFNVLEFIGKLCQDNKLLFRCLPVYDNLYSAEAFKNIFRPLSLYNGSDKLHRRIGNTYLLMYPYEPSNKLNLLQDKTNDVSYQYDSFNFADSFGKITDEAANLFKEGDGENICAFGVTPGAQNQSYFTRVSVGMDNPRVTDFAIRNKFALAQTGVGGRSEAEGTGQDMYSIYSNRSYDCNVEMLGCANIMPMMYFQLNNVPMFNGAYMITKVEHNIQNNAMTTKFTGTRMSRYYIPYNKSLFLLQDLQEIINKLNGEDGKNIFALASSPIKLLSDDGNTMLSEISNEIIVQPSSETVIHEFNVWAAVNQMAQCYAHSSYDPNYVPLNYGYSKKIDITNGNGYCATAVEMFLMAGFFGVFGANNGKQGIEIDEYRSIKSINNQLFKGENGFDMRKNLAKFGFRCIAYGADTIIQMGKEGKLQSGDVCVMKNKDSIGGVGHVCMYTGSIWVSDYRQNKLTTGKTDVNNPMAVLLYRHPKVVSKPQVYLYYENGKLVENYKNNNGYVDNIEMLTIKNAVE